MASPSRREGLRCECGKLLLEKDQKMGLGIRCGRAECRKFHPLSEINKRAAEFQKEGGKGIWRDSMPKKEKDHRKMMEVFDFVRLKGFLWGAGNLDKVIFHFSVDGSNDEVDEQVKGQHLGYYRPNERIHQRLQNELPHKTSFLFEKHGIQLILIV